MAAVSREIVIIGLTESGPTFRASDGAERLCGCLAVFGEDQRIRYSPLVKPVMSDGIKCVVVNCRLEGVDPIAYCFLMSFATDNELQNRQGRSAIRAPRPLTPALKHSEVAA